MKKHLCYNCLKIITIINLLNRVDWLRQLLHEQLLQNENRESFSPRGRLSSATLDDSLTSCFKLLILQDRSTTPCDGRNCWTVAFN